MSLEPKIELNKPSSLDGKPLSYNPGSLYNPEFIAVADKNLPWLDVLGIA